MQDDTGARDPLLEGGRDASALAAPADLPLRQREALLPLDRRVVGEQRAAARTVGGGNLASGAAIVLHDVIGAVAAIAGELVRAAVVRAAPAGICRRRPAAARGRGPAAARGARRGRRGRGAAAVAGGAKGLEAGLAALVLHHAACVPAVGVHRVVRVADGVGVAPAEALPARPVGALCRSRRRRGPGGAAPPRRRRRRGRGRGAPAPRVPALAGRGV
mmetsp:Transcript_98559/g.306929  ORF Transcript_98559/g.306929 Transcript_98559/m.306929 type:complete len:218 (+) Transcript_98559:1764-2417(+)